MKEEMASEQQIKRSVERALDGLPVEKMGNVLDFTLFLRARWTEERDRAGTAKELTGLTLRSIPASHLDGLAGLVAWGGDAVADSERLYDDGP